MARLLRLHGQIAVTESSDASELSRSQPRRGLLSRSLSASWPALATGWGIGLAHPVWSEAAAYGFCSPFILGLAILSAGTLGLRALATRSDRALSLALLPLGLLLILPTGLIAGRVAGAVPVLSRVTWYRKVEGFHFTASGPGNDRSFRLDHAWFGGSRIPDVSVHLPSMSYRLAWTDGPHPALTEAGLRERLERWGYCPDEAAPAARGLFNALQEAKDGIGVPKPAWRAWTATPWVCVFDVDDPTHAASTLALWTPLLLVAAAALLRRPSASESGIPASRP